MTESPDVHVVTDLPEEKNFNLKKVVGLALTVFGLVVAGAAIGRSEMFSSKGAGDNVDPTLATIAP